MNIFEPEAERVVLKTGGKSLERARYGWSPRHHGSVIIMLHEGLGSVGLWRKFTAQIAQATASPVFAYSQTGYGQSQVASMPRPLDYMTREACDVLPEILDTLTVSSFVLLGHSESARSIRYSCPD